MQIEEFAQVLAGNAEYKTGCCVHGEVFNRGYLRPYPMLRHTNETVNLQPSCGCWRTKVASGVGLVMAVLALGCAKVAATTGSGLTNSLVREFTLEECLELALQNNRRRPASRFAVAVAEAQHRQALSGYWPHLNLRGGYARMDQPPNFVFPAGDMHVPGGTAYVNVPAGVLGPAAVQLPVSFPDQQIAIPEQNIKVMDADSFIGAVSATWLLYDGGMRSGYRQQTSAGLEAARQEARRTDLEIVDTVKRYYHGAVLARQLHQLGRDTFERMNATLQLTETMYQGGGGKVTKTDFLDNKVMVESIRAIVALVEKNELMAQAALANALGMSWSNSVAPVAPDIPFAPFAGNLSEMVGVAYRFNPDWARLEAGIRAAEGSVKTARSGHAPKVALTGEIHKWWNGYSAGAATERNKEGATVGLALEMPLFDGFLTRGKVEEARARLGKIKEQGFLLREGIGLQIKNVFLGLEAARKSYHATREAMSAAIENRELNLLAYQNELVETEKVIRAQLTEAFMSAQHYKSGYDHVVLQSELNLLVGAEVLKQIQGAPAANKTN